MTYNTETKRAENSNKLVKEKQLTTLRPIDEVGNFENVFVGGTRSALNVATSSVKVSGELKVTDYIKTPKIASVGIALTINSNTIDAEANKFRFRNANTGDVYAGLQHVVSSSSIFTLYSAGGSAPEDYFSIVNIANGATQILSNDDAGTNAYILIQADGYMKTVGATTNRLQADGGDITLDASTGIYKFLLDSDSDDLCTLTVAANGETTLATADSDGAVGHLNIEPDGHVEFDNCAVGFDLLTPTYNASDTDVSFINGNKQFVTFGAGNITDLNLIFPATSGNFVLLVKQDGTGSRTITNYKAWDLVNSDAASGSATVKFAGGSNPTLTTDANHVDILSFFWDADNQIAYGVATLDFQF